VKRNKEGIYVLFDYETDPKVVQRLERYCILNESIIKHMTVRAEDIPEPRTKEITKPVYDEDEEDFTHIDFEEDEDDIDYEEEDEDDEDN
ncbi:MAG: 30S ribosomal protein S6, partial [Candidatus Poribacteria bacterium]